MSEALERRREAKREYARIVRNTNIVSANINEMNHIRSLRLAREKAYAALTPAEREVAEKEKSV